MKIIIKKTVDIHRNANSDNVLTTDALSMALCNK